MFLYRYLFLVFLFIPVIGYALPGLVEENYFASSNAPALSSSSLYLADNRDYSSSSGMRTISQGQYMGGGVASIFLGFGVGHAIQGRWKERGWIHTVVQSVSLITSLGVVFVGLSTMGSPSAPGGGMTLVGGPVWGPVGIIASFVLTGSKIWEVVDVWMLPDSVRIISSSRKTGTSSLYSYEPRVNVPGVSLQWQF